MGRTQPTVRAIAKIAGVSISTVSRALSASAPVSSAARRKIEEAIEFLNRSDIPAAAAAGGRNVGIIMPADSSENLKEHPLLYSIVSSFEDYLASFDIVPRMLNYNRLPDEIGGLLQQPMDGYFVVGTSAEDDAVLLEAMQNRQIPWVIMNRRLEHESVSYVCIDDEHASEAAVNHFIGLKHRRIAFLGGNRDYQNTSRRYSGYAAALQKAGIPLREEYVFFGQYSELSGYLLGKELLTLRPLPTAAFCASDTIAIGCMQYLSRHGVQIPRDIAVFGFGNVDKGRNTIPALSTVDQRYEDTGVIAAKTLLQLMDTPSIAYQHVLVKTKLLIRESSGGTVNGLK